MAEKAALLSVDAALRMILAGVDGPLAVEETPLAACYGRTLARDLVARRTQPPKALSAMDGYALRAEDSGPRKVIGESSAGRGFSGVCGPGEALRIFTGAPLPQGADSVVIQEETQRDGDAVTPTAPIEKGANIRVEGVDFREGQTIFARGRRLSPADIALAAAADHALLPVARKPRVCVISTGDELVAPGAPRGPDQIVATNAFALFGQIAAAGGEALDLGAAPDRIEDIAAAIEAAKERGADILVTSGGASVGDRDLARKALAREGMELAFWRVATKPGKPLIHGHIGAMKVLGLPGNPVSAFVSGELFLKPLIRALCGDPGAGDDRSEPAFAAAPLPAGGARQEFLRAALSYDEDGRLLAAPLPDQDSSLTRALAQAEALIVRAPQAPPGPAGAPVRIIRLRD